MTKEPQDHQQAQEELVNNVPQKGDKVKIGEDLELTLKKDISDSRLVRRATKLAKLHQEAEDGDQEATGELLNTTYELLEAAFGTRGLEKVEDYFDGDLQKTLGSVLAIYQGAAGK